MAQKVVFDVGSKYTKAGFGSESFPRCVCPSVVGRFRKVGLFDGFPDIYGGNEAIQKRGLSDLTWPVCDGLIQNWDEMEKLWHHIFYKGLHVAPEECDLVHAVHPLISRGEMERMSEILFETFTVEGLYLAKSPALVLHATARTTGVVWENGYSCAYAAPVFEGFPLVHSTVTSPLTGNMLGTIFQKMLADVGFSFTTEPDMDFLESIMAGNCYVASNYEEECDNIGEDVRFNLPDGQHVILGKERYKCPEVLFKPSLHGLDCPNIVDTIHKSILTCEMEFRSTFCENIVISGGSTMFAGFQSRLSQELDKKMLYNPETNPKVDAVESRHIAAWVGGSILASLSSLPHFRVSRKEYEDNGLDAVRNKLF